MADKAIMANNIMILLDFALFNDKYQNGLLSIVLLTTVSKTWRPTMSSNIANLIEPTS